jgi:hypothetical protein
MLVSSLSLLGTLPTQKYMAEHNRKYISMLIKKKLRGKVVLDKQA